MKSMRNHEKSGMLFFFFVLFFLIILWKERSFLPESVFYTIIFLILAMICYFFAYRSQRRNLQRENPSLPFSMRIDERTELKQLERKDAHALFLLTDRSRAHLREWLPWVDGTKTERDSRVFIENTIRQAASQKGVHAGIWYRGELAGVIGFHSIDWTNASTSIGYWLGAEFQGKGLMTKACRAMVDHAFEKMKMHRVEIRCGVMNQKSCAITQRLGFRYEGTIREAEWLYDHYIDHKVYGLLRKEWQQIKDEQNRLSHC